MGGVVRYLTNDAVASVLAFQAVVLLVVLSEAANVGANARSLLAPMAADRSVHERWSVALSFMQLPTGNAAAPRAAARRKER